MKQIIFIFCMILMLSFCGCTNVGSNRNEYMSNWFKSEQEISDNMMKQIIDLYNEGNVKEFEKLFSQNSKKDIEDINKQISSFFEFIDGDIQEYSGDCASSSENNNGNKRIELDGMYHISTSKNEYYLNFYMVYKADDVPSDIGLSKTLCGIHQKTEYLSCGNKHRMICLKDKPKQSCDTYFLLLFVF